MVNNKVASLVLWSILIIAAVWTLSGCSTPFATKEGMIVEPISGAQRTPYTVNVKTQGGVEPDADRLPGIPNEDFARAIEESIIKSGLFSRVIQGQGAEYSLDVSIISMSKPILEQASP